LDPSYFNTFAAILEWRHKLFFGICFQIPEAIRAEKNHFQKKVSRETPKTGLLPPKRIADVEGLRLAHIGQGMIPQKACGERDCRGRPQPSTPPLGVRAPAVPRRTGTGPPKHRRAGRPPARDGLVHQRDKWGVGGLIYNDILGPFSLRCFLRIRFGIRNQPANSGRAYTLVGRKGWAAGFVGIPHRTGFTPLGARPVRILAVPEPWYSVGLHLPNAGQPRRITAPHQRMAKRHRGTRTLQEETAALSYTFAGPCNKRADRTWRAFYRQRRMRIEPPQRVWRRGGPITEYAYRLDLHVRADVRPSADIITDGVCGCIWLADSRGAIGAIRRSRCGVFHMEHNRCGLAPRNRGRDEYVSRETL